MVEFVKGKALIGPILAILGSLLLIMTPVFVPELDSLVIMAIILGIVGLLGALLAATDNVIGNYITIIIGFIATIGTNIFVFSLYFEPILVLVGGVLGVLIKNDQ